MERWNEDVPLELAGKGDRGARKHFASVIARIAALSVVALTLAVAGLYLASRGSRSEVLEAITPDSGSTVTMPAPTFRWSGSGRGTGYRLEIAKSDDGAFTTPIVTSLASATSYTITTNLPDGSYLWRVREVRTSKETWSAVERFRVRTRSTFGPDPSYRRPAGSVLVGVGSLTQRLLDTYPEDASFWLAASVHRIDGVLRPKAGQQFHGQPGAVISGAKVLSGFVREGHRWYVGGQSQRLPPHGNHSVCGAKNPLCYLSEEVYVNNDFRDRVRSLDDVGPGRWFFDHDRGRIYLGDDPTEELVETTVASQLFAGGAQDVVVRNLVVEKFGSRLQRGAVEPGGAAGWQVRNCEFRLNHGGGVGVDNGGRLADSSVHDNGQLGTGGNGAGAVFEHNEIARNNRLGVDPEWEAGGTKWAFTNGLVVRGNWVHDNLGNGLWTDLDNVDTLYEDNLVERNEGAGLLHEVSFKATIRNNVLANNGGHGIFVMDSSDVEAYENRVAWNRGGGIGGRQDKRVGGPEQWSLSRLWVHDNDVTMTSGTTGLYDWVGDGRVFDQDNRFDRNAYTTPSSPVAWWEWQGERIGAGRWKRYGQDVHGTFRSL
jgi:parallel beta-helix repeat protein